ncbi:MAG: pyridoxamine 5'-phosphate oxidase family protein [Intrasporangiaceae bacterium]|nr:pyridoxamine 5'-phosphate oxidase family protein [Intrasporangiaceae bacterium]
MSGDENVVTKLKKDECWDLLRDNTFGRIAYHLRGRSRITPLNYTVDGERIVFRTAEGSKFFALKVEDNVALQIDHVGEDTAWSVVAHGPVTEITNDEDLAEATVNLRPLIRTKKEHVFAIDVDKVRGRRFILDRGRDDNF